MASTDKARDERLAAALRDNLRKRKARARETGSNDERPSAPDSIAGDGPSPRRP